MTADDAKDIATALEIAPEHLVLPDVRTVVTTAIDANSVTVLNATLREAYRIAGKYYAVIEAIRSRHHWLVGPREHDRDQPFLWWGT